jgi:uncharacterized membrane protein
MVRFENEISIERPVEEVYKFVADLENLPKWNYYIEDVSKTSPAPKTNGTEYHQVRKGDAQDLRVKEHIPNRLLIIETIPPSRPELRREMVFQPESGSTQLLDTWNLDLGLPTFIEKISANRVRSAVQENLEKLKILLETGQVTLQDGRLVRI